MASLVEMVQEARKRFSPIPLVILVCDRGKKLIKEESYIAFPNVRGAYVSHYTREQALVDEAIQADPEMLEQVVGMTDDHLLLRLTITDPADRRPR